MQQQSIDLHKIVGFDGLLQVGDNAKHFAWIKLRRVGRKDNPHAKIFEFGYQFFLYLVGIDAVYELRHRTRPVQIVGLVKGGIFYRIKQNYLTFNEFNEVKQQIFAFVFVGMLNVFVKKLLNNLLRAVALPKAFFAFLHQQRQQRTRAVNVLKGQAQKQTIVDVVPRNNGILISVGHFLVG